MIIIEHRHSSERQCVGSLDGYPAEDWRVVEEGVARPRGHCVRDGGRWRVDRDRHDLRRAELSVGEVAALRERIRVLEAQQDEGSK